VLEGGAIGGDDRPEGWCGGQELGHRGDFDIGDAARDDGAEPGEVGVDVEGEAVAGDTALDADADGGDFGTVHPDAGATADTFSDDVEAGEGVNDRLFEEADVINGADGAGMEIENGVGHKLAGAVEGNIATSIGGDHLDATSGEFGDGGDDVGAIGGGAEGKDGAVLDEGERFACLEGVECRWFVVGSVEAISLKLGGGFELP
jgi:hypothetical protein